MIELTRALARRFRTVLRRSLLELAPRRSWPLVLCRTGDEGLTLQAGHIDLALHYHQPGERPPESMAFSAEVLAECEGRTETPVVLEQVAAGKGHARWDDGGAPCCTEFVTASPEADVPKFPAPPAALAPMPEDFLPALDEASRTAARESGRFALSRLQWRGRQGDVVATDGRSLLIQKGFPFPWQDTLLIPRLSVFGCREFAGAGAVALGRTKSHVALRCGPWTLLLTIDVTSRYPDVDAVIPRAAGATTRLRLDARDAARLVTALPKMPGCADGDAPVTLDLASPPAVRACVEGSDQVAELPLVSSTVSGPAVRLCTNAPLLHRAVKLGFTELQVFGADKPLLCRDERRLYLWVPLDPKRAVAPAVQGSCKALVATGRSPLSPPLDDKEKPAMPPPSTNGHDPSDGRGPDASPERWGIEEVIAETETLRGVLQDAAARTARLLAALKNQRRHSRAVRAAMVSLQQLKLDQ